MTHESMFDVIATERGVPIKAWTRLGVKDLETRLWGQTRLGWGQTFDLRGTRLAWGQTFDLRVGSAWGQTFDLPSPQGIPAGVRPSIFAYELGWYELGWGQTFDLRVRTRLTTRLGSDLRSSVAEVEARTKVRPHPPAERIGVRPSIFRRRGRGKNEGPTPRTQRHAPNAPSLAILRLRRCAELHMLSS